MSDRDQERAPRGGPMSLDDKAREIAKFYALRACREETRQDILSCLRAARDQGRREGLKEAQGAVLGLIELSRSVRDRTPEGLHQRISNSARQEAAHAIARLAQEAPE